MGIALGLHTNHVYAPNSSHSICLIIEAILTSL
jgi:hypothetical protein